MSLGSFKMKKTVAIVQSNYIPWKGYFDIIAMSDLFVFHDDLQYTKQDWRNRNIIKTPRGTEWLSIPCGSNENRLICEVVLRDHTWQIQHWRKIIQHYQHASYFKSHRGFFEDFYLHHKWDNLSDLNQYLIPKISQLYLGIKTEFDDSRRYNLMQNKSSRVLELLKKVGANIYLSGPAARNYLDEKQFEDAGIQIEWMDYGGYPEYDQLYPPFEHNVSIIDLLFNTGDAARTYLKSYSDKISYDDEVGKTRQNISATKNV